MAIEGIIQSPSLVKIRTIGEKEHFLNSNLIVSFSPSQEAEGLTDIVMLNGQVHTVKETPNQLVENRYRRDVARGSSVLNLIA
ncbi:hypothetical protein IJ425_02450 [bacterium]|nr:hypothetical protein [bacterium]